LIDRASSFKDESLREADEMSQPRWNWLAGIDRYRPSENVRCWDLPPWGHELAHGIFPLALVVNEHLLPIATAFTFGKHIHFMISADHAITTEALKHEPSLSRYLTREDMPRSIDLRAVGFALLFRRPPGGPADPVATWAIETVEAASPTDVVFGHPVAQSHFPVLDHRLSFDLPAAGEAIRSLGYTDFVYPTGGISLADVQNGNFDWDRDYSHRFCAVAGSIEHVYGQGFARQFIEGPCFSFDAEIPGGLSGGPILTLDRVVRGVNSAGATNFYNRPASIGSLLYPLLMTELRFEVRGEMISKPLPDLIAREIIKTDGSEGRVRLQPDPEAGGYLVVPRAPANAVDHIYDNFASYQDGRRAERATGDFFRLNLTPREDQGARES
jgi:hypothetical protein